MTVDTEPIQWPEYDARAYVFVLLSGIHFDGDLSSAGAKTITIHSGVRTPVGVSGTDSGHYLRISGGTGATEDVLITGGTAVSGSTNAGTLQFTTVNAHTGNFTITSASGGVQEAISDNASLGVGTSDMVLAESGNLTLGGDLTAASVTASGDVTGANAVFVAGPASIAGTFTGPAGGTSARFSDASNSTLMVTHGASPVPNSAVLEGTGSTSVTLKASTGIVARVTGSARETIGQVTIPDGSMAGLGNLCAGGTYGSVKIVAVAGTIFGEVMIQGGLNTVIQISDLSSNISTTDTAGQLCILSTGGGTYAIKNRIGASVTLIVRFMGL